MVKQKFVQVAKGQGLSKTYQIRLELDSTETDPNRLNGVDWRDKHERFKKIKKDIYLMTRNKTPQTPLTEFNIKVLRVGPKTFDWDNLVASLKPAIDGLTLAGIIFDDNWEFIKKIDIDQKTSKTEKKLIITVEGTSDGRIPKIRLARTKKTIGTKRRRPARRKRAQG